MKTYSPRFREIDLSGVVDEGLDVIERQIYADAITNGRTHGLGAKQIRPMPSRTDAGHSTVEFVGGPEASFVRHFERPARRAIFKTPQEYSRMAHDANMSRLNEIIRQRPVPQPLRTGF